MQHYRIAILGSGPAGCTAALYVARASLQPAMIKGLEPGGQLTTTTDVDNWPADEQGVQGPELMERFLRHATKYGGQEITDHIVDVDLTKRPFVLSGNQKYSCDALIIATGASAKYLGLPSEQQYKGKGVSACATCDGFFFRDQPVCVIGGGNTAVEEALYLANICSEVTLVHRRDEFRAEAIMMEKLFVQEQAGKIKIKRSFVLDEVIGDGKKVTGVRLRSVTDQNNTELDVHGVFIAIGHQPNTALFAGKLEMDEGYLITRAGRDGMSSATSCQGVFAAGDVHDHTYRQAVTSAASGCIAALDAVRYLRDND